MNNEWTNQWRKKLRKIEISASKILSKDSRRNSFLDENPISTKKLEDEVLDEDNIIEIYSIAIASFNIIFRQKDVKIFAVFMKNLKIQLKKQESSTITNSRSVMSIEYHDFLNVFSKKKTNILSSHKKHDHRIKLKKEYESEHEYASLYNLSEEELLLIKKYLKEHLNKEFIEFSTALYVHSYYLLKSQMMNCDFVSIIKN
jgi:hypothetical protein